MPLVIRRIRLPARAIPPAILCFRSIAANTLRKAKRAPGFPRAMLPRPAGRIAAGLKLSTALGGDNIVDPERWIRRSQDNSMFRRSSIGKIERESALQQGIVTWEKALKNLPRSGVCFSSNNQLKLS